MRQSIRHMRTPLWTAVALVASPAASQEAPAPMWYLEAFGSPGREIAPILWALLWQSIIVVGLVTLLVVLGLVAKARLGVEMRDDHRSVAPPHDRHALRWMFGGLLATLCALAFFTVWTVTTLASVRAPDEAPGVTIEVTGHQWWWQVTYLSDDTSRIFETANEIHVPVGVPVELRLKSADVIHSFWVPAIAGKTDLIPGQENTAWFRVDEPGVFRGQCAEYCDLQHAHMALRVIAEPPDEFATWWDRMLEPAEEPESPEAQEGLALFRLNCSACHAVRGMLPGGEMGPDLSHLMRRETLAAGMMPNSPGHLSGWIANPDVLKPGTLMPRTDLSGAELDKIRAFLTTLE